MPSQGLVARVSRARKSLEKLRRIAEKPWDEYSVNEDLQVLTERHLQVLLEAILDIASYIAARLGIAKGPTYRHVMESLLNEGILPGELRGLALAIPGMRNILVHGYAGIRHDLIYESLRRDLSSLARILSILWHKAEELDP